MILAKLIAATAKIRRIICLLFYMVTKACVWQEKTRASICCTLCISSYACRIKTVVSSLIPLFPLLITFAEALLEMNTCGICGTDLHCPEFGGIDHIRVNKIMTIVQ